jgi:LacI family transcriptional regulator
VDSKHDPRNDCKMAPTTANSKAFWIGGTMNLKQLAGRLGLSTTTVSRALNGYPEVSAETRARVIAAAREHGYAPNQMARRLATGRTLAIGHVIPLARYPMIDPVFADFIAGVGETSSAAGYDMLLSVVPEADEAEAYRALAAQRKVDAVMVHGPRVIDPRIDLLIRLGLPFLVHGRDSRPESDYCWIDMNNRRAFRRATEYLLDLGHRRIALLNGPEVLNYAHRRRRGYEEALRNRGIAVDPALVRSTEMVEPEGYEASRALLAGLRPPTVFLTSSMLVAFGTLRAVHDLGLELGRDVSILTHDDDLSFLQPAPATVPLFSATRSSIRAAGRRAAELLIARIEDPGGPPVGELWEAELTLGRSTGPAIRQESHV